MPEETQKQESPQLESEKLDQTEIDEEFDEVIRNPKAVVKTIKALRAELKSLKSRKSDSATETATIPPEIEAELERLRSFVAKKEEEEKERQRKDLEARGQYEALLRDAKIEAEKQTNALKEKTKFLESELQKRESLLAETEAKLKEYRLRTAARDAFFAQGGRRGDESQGGDFYFNLLWENALKNNIHEGKNGIEIIEGDSLLLDDEKKPVDLQGLIKLRKTTYGFAFEGEPSSSGSGKPPTSSGRIPTQKAKLTISRASLGNRSELLRWAKAHNVDPASITAGIQTGEITIE